MVRLKLLVGVALTIVSLPCELMAQRGYTARTAEYLTASSDLVLRAVITDVEIRSFEPNDEVIAAEARNLELATITLHVSRCLKGTTDDSIRIEITQGFGDTRLREWKTSKTNLFWFFDVEKADENGLTRIVPRADHRFWDTIVEPPNLSAERKPIMLLNVDLQPLTTEKMVEDSIVQYVERFGTSRTGGTKVSISPEIAARSGQRQAANYVLLPLNFKEIRSK